MNNNAIIFGDSYSTFSGYIPEGYAVYYSENGSGETDVRRVEETWWHQLISESGLNLIRNDSWSGSTVCYTGYDNLDCSETSSFIYRFRKLVSEGFFEENEIGNVFVFGGTNDSWANAPLGEVKEVNAQEKDLYFVLPAINYFFKVLRETLPDANIYCIINTELKSEIEECFKTSSIEHHITPISLEAIDKAGGHPTIKGMREIKDQVRREIEKANF